MKSCQQSLLVSFFATVVFKPLIYCDSFFGLPLSHFYASCQPLLYSLCILGLAPPSKEEGRGFRLMDTSTPLPNDDVDGYHMLTNAVAMALRSVGIFFFVFFCLLLFSCAF